MLCNLILILPLYVYNMGEDHSMVVNKLLDGGLQIILFMFTDVHIGYINMQAI